MTNYQLGTSTLTPIPSHPTVIGVDLGGTKIAFARFNAHTMQKEEEFQIPTQAQQSIDHVIDAMEEGILKLKNDATTGIGIGVPGLITYPDGIVATLPNIPGAEGCNIQEALYKRIGVPVYVDNDANCFALAEAVDGVGQKHRVVIGITMGTGVGGGIIIEGKIFHGARGFAGEIGHMLLRPGEPPYDTEDKRGDIEQFFSGSALGKRCQQAVSPTQYLEGGACKYLHCSIEKEIAWMCASLTHVLDPSIIIFGGSAGRALAPHLEKVQEELQHWVLPHTPLPLLAIAELKDAGTRGAALLVPPAKNA